MSSDLWHLADKLCKIRILLLHYVSNTFYAPVYFRWCNHANEECKTGDISKSCRLCFHHLPSLKQTDDPSIMASCWKIHTEYKSMQRDHQQQCGNSIGCTCCYGYHYIWLLLLSRSCFYTIYLCVFYGTTVILYSFRVIYFSSVLFCRSHLQSRERHKQTCVEINSHTQQIRPVGLFLPLPPSAAGQIRLDGKSSY